MISNCKLHRINKRISIFWVVAAKNYGRKMLIQIQWQRKRILDFFFCIPGSALFIQLCCTGCGARTRADENYFVLAAGQYPGRM